MRRSRTIKREPETDNRLTTGVCLGLCLGMFLGIAVWSITDKIFWMPIMSALGLSLGVAASVLLNSEEKN